MITRDKDLFPEDETGDNLWHLLNQGCDLNQIFEIEFSMIFPTQQQALAFCANFVRKQPKNFFLHLMIRTLATIGKLLLIHQCH